MPSPDRHGQDSTRGVILPLHVGLRSILLLVALLALLALGLSVTGSDDVPPERVMCDECHDDFVAFQYTIGAPSEVPAGEPFDISITVLNEEMHAVYYPMAMVTVSDPEGMVVETGEPAVVDIREEGSVGFRQSETLSIPVLGGAEEAHFSLSASGGPLDILTLSVVGPDGGSWSSGGSGTDSRISLDQDDIHQGGFGDYMATVTRVRGVRQLSFTLDVGVAYGSGSMVLHGPEDLQQDDSYTFVFTLRGVTEGPSDLMVTLSGTAVHSHTSGQYDEQEYTYDETVPIEVGDEFVHGPGDDGDDGGPAGDLLDAGQVLGFLSATLLAVSIATSGNMGRFKLPRRAKVHCWSSYMLLGTFIVHWALLYVGPYGPPAALGTGLVLLLCIGVLAVTGARPSLLDGTVAGLSSRRLHLLVTYGTVMVLAVHVVLNGSHLAFLRG